MKIVTVCDADTLEVDAFRFTDAVIIGANGDEGVTEAATSKSGRLNRALLASGAALHCAARPDPAAELAALSRLAGRIADFEARVAGGGR